MSLLDKIALKVQLLARILAILILGFTLFMVGAHLVEAFTNPEVSFVEGFNSRKDAISFIFFPISLMIGLAIALRYELVGGFISIAAMFSLFIVRPDLITSLAMTSMVLPGLLFIVCWILKKIAIRRRES